jgi:hypothetical protein
MNLAFLVLIRSVRCLSMSWILRACVMVTVLPLRMLTSPCFSMVGLSRVDWCIDNDGLPSVVGVHARVCIYAGASFYLFQGLCFLSE